MKKILKNTAISIGISLTIFCISGIIFDIIYQGNFNMESYGFTKMVLGCLLIGMGYGIPTVIYQKENLPRPIQITVHMGIGCSVYTVAAFLVGWPANLGVGKCALIVLFQLIVAFIILFLFMVHYRKEAMSINKKLQEMK